MRTQAGRPETEAIANHGHCHDVRLRTAYCVGASVVNSTSIRRHTKPGILTTLASYHNNYYGAIISIGEILFNQNCQYKHFQNEVTVFSY